MYSNDFAQWVGEEVGDEELAAALSDISGAEPATIEDIRREIVAILEPAADERRGRSEFVFVGMVLSWWRLNTWPKPSPSFST